MWKGFYLGVMRRIIISEYEHAIFVLVMICVANLPKFTIYKFLNVKLASVCERNHSLYVTSISCRHLLFYSYIFNEGMKF